MKIKQKYIFLFLFVLMIGSAVFSLLHTTGVGAYQCPEGWVYEPTGVDVVDIGGGGTRAAYPAGQAPNVEPYRLTHNYGAGDCFQYIIKKADDTKGVPVGNAITYTCPSGSVTKDGLANTGTTNTPHECYTLDKNQLSFNNSGKVIPTLDNGQAVTNWKCVDDVGKDYPGAVYIEKGKGVDKSGCYGLDSNGKPYDLCKNQSRCSRVPAGDDTSIHDDAVTNCKNAGGNQQDCDAIGTIVQQCIAKGNASKLDCQNLGTVIQQCQKSGKSVADCQNEAQAMIDNCNRLVSNNTYKSTADCIKASATQAYGCPGGQAVVDYSTNACADGSTAAQVGSGTTQTQKPQPGTCGKVKTLIIPCSGQGLEAIATVLKFVLTILSVGVGIVAVGGIVYGSALYAGARDNGGQVQQGITIIRDVVIGVLMYIFMVAILSWLVPGIWS